MLRLKSYIKPFILLLLIAIGLLYVQAQMDLALPDYLSKIVNIGIQQSGVEEEIPEILTVNDYEILKEFLDDGSIELLETYYSYSENHDFKLDQPLYVLKDLNADEEKAYKTSITPAFNMIISIRIQMNSGEDMIFNDQKIPAGSDVISILLNMPAEARGEILSGMSNNMSGMSDELASQMNINMVKTYYEEIGVDIGNMQSKFIIKTGALMLVITLIGALSSIAVGFFAARIGAGVARNLRNDVFKRVLSFSNTEFDKFSTASLITRSTNDITQVQNILVLMIRMVFYAPLMGIGGVIRALDKNVSMSWIIALAVIILMMVIGILFTIALPKFKMIQKMVDKVNLIIREHLSGMLVIRAFNTQKFEESRFDETNEELTKINLFVNRLMALLFPVMMFVMNGVMVMIIWLGAKEIADANMQVGDMMAYMQYAMQIIMSFLMLSMMFIMVPRASVSAARIADVLETDITILDPQQPSKPEVNKKGLVQFKNVKFKYPGADTCMLKDISFEAKPGQMTAIIGSTGAGKTTLVNLINRFYDATEGSIEVSGVNVKELTQEDLRAQIGYVPQKSYLFSGSITSNLKYGKENATVEELTQAMEIAQGSEIIQGEEGLNKLVAQGGQNYSGGQKQRLSIARALVKKPEIFIFDDSFSALDFKTDAQLRKALHEYASDKTMIVIAQRVSTIMNADQIIVLEDGKMVGIGTHEELLKSCDTYYEIASTQLTKEELS
ncbi:MAG: ABC transporter ATP-binding protein [Clostridia bacterium]|nr:ABC transporter ATP-binding protein [Clostridia bacterium]